MKRGILVIILIFGLVLSALPLVSANNQDDEQNKLERYSNCYVEISGLESVHDYPRIFGINMWKILFLRPNGQSNPEATVFYWYIYLDETAQVSVYSQQGGELLWQHSGTGMPVVRMLMFNGDYVSTNTEEGRLQLDINGQVRSFWIYVR